jgi:hypothetical protein
LFCNINENGYIIKRPLRRLASGDKKFREEKRHILLLAFCPEARHEKPWGRAPEEGKERVYGGGKI